METGFKLSRVRNLLFLCGIVFVVGVVAFSITMKSMGDSDANASNGGSAYDARPAQMEKLNITRFFVGAEVDATIASTQSMAITDKYLVVVQTPSSGENNWIIALDLANPDSEPVWSTSYNVGHGNAATWNSRTNEIIVAEGTSGFVFDADDGSYKRTMDIKRACSGLAYVDIDPQQDYYLQMCGDTGRIVLSDFTTWQSFNTAHPLVNQDAAYHNGYLYRIGWGGCNFMASQGRLTEEVAICRNEFGEGSNVIYQFDANGDFVKAFYLEPGTVRGAQELESMAFDSSGTAYLLFNGVPDSTHYSIYSIDNVLEGGSSDPGGGSNKRDQNITFESQPKNITLGSNESYAVRATTDGDGEIKYYSSDSSVASIDISNGALEIHRAGATIISVVATGTETCNQNISAYTLIVTDPSDPGTDPSDPGTDPSDPGSGGQQQPQNFHFEIKPERIVRGSSESYVVKAVINDDRTIHYFSSNKNVATIDELNGALTIKGVGTTKITAMVYTVDNYAMGVIDYNLTVVESGQSTDDPSDPGTDPSDPGTDPSDPGTDPSDPGTDPSDPGTDPSDPGTDPSDPGDNPNQKLSQTITFTVAPYKITYGSDENYTVTATTTGNGAITYTSSNSSVATINRTTGALTIKGVGTTTITATAAETVSFNESSRRYTLTVVAQSDPGDDPSDPSDDPSDPGTDPSDSETDPSDSETKPDSSKDSQNQTENKTSGKIIVPDTGENKKDGGMVMDVVIVLPVLLIVGVVFGCVAIKRVKIGHRKFD